jgi:Cullin family
VNVLSASAWPTYPDVAVNVPDSISKAVRDFDMHYNSKHSGRKLTWKHNLAHCQVKASFPRGDKEFMVSSFQAIVLLLFNDVDKSQLLSYIDIQNATGLSKSCQISLSRTTDRIPLTSASRR